jgi:integrase
MATFQKRGTRWRALIRRIDQPSVSKSFSTKAEAERWAREVERNMDHGEWNDPTLLRDVTVGELIERYIEELPGLRKIPPNKKSAFNNIDIALGDLRLSQLTKQAVAKFGADRAKEVSPATLAMDLTALSDLVRTARAYWGIPVKTDAVDDARLVLRRTGAVGKAKERDRRISDEELQTLREHWARVARRHNAKTPMYAITRFAIVSGMRLSEICRIEWCDLNVEDRTIIIRDRKHPTQKIGNDQEVPLLGEAWTIVQAQPREDGEPRIFPYKPETVSNLFTRAVQRCRIDNLYFHDTRHEATSRLFEQGYQIHEVALVTGHKDWRQLRRYTRIRAKDLHR